jgi:hypothetical protein
MQNTRYLSCAESAKLLRSELKAEFPGVKFSVRSSTYAGGASISVEWLDGPTERQVQAVTARYAARDFDGMIDMASGRQHWLTPQGEIHVAQVQGTEASRGVIASAEFIRPHDDAELVTLGSHYVSTSRHYSRAMLERACDWAEKTWGERPRIREAQPGGPCWLEADRPVDPYRYPQYFGCNTTIADVANHEMRQQAGPRHRDRSH